MKSIKSKINSLNVQKTILKELIKIFKIMHFLKNFKILDNLKKIFR